MKDSLVCDLIFASQISCSLTTYTLNIDQNVLKRREASVFEVRASLWEAERMKNRHSCFLVTEVDSLYSPARWQQMAFKCPFHLRHLQTCSLLCQKLSYKFSGPQDECWPQRKRLFRFVRHTNWALQQAVHTEMLIYTPSRHREIIVLSWRCFQVVSSKELSDCFAAKCSTVTC